MSSIFTMNASQICSAASRLLVHEDVHEELVARLIGRVESLTLGPGVDDPDLGPLVLEDQLRTVEKYVEIGHQETGDPVVGGETSARDGYFVEPTIFDTVLNDARIAQEEIFGTVLTVIPFPSEEEAIRVVNDTPYGLIAGVFT